MNMETARECAKRPAADAGIAIGPILFIIAVLGILAAAIAAGSGSFTTSTTGESNRTKGAALIEIGQNLKVGMDRILADGTSTIASVTINTANTSATTDLFSPVGGGIAAPSTTMAYTAANVWYYPRVVVPGIGTDAGAKLALIRVTPGVCDEINLKANGIATTSTPGASPGAAVDFGDITASALLDATVTGAWPSTPDFTGKPTGCLNISDATVAPAGYYFYQVIAIE